MELATKELATKELAIKELATNSGSSLGDIYQLYDVQRQFGEQDQQAPMIEEVKEFGQIEAQSLLDHEMAEMSPVEWMSYLQSQMHVDESMEGNADSFITVCRRSFWETRCNGHSGK